MHRPTDITKRSRAWSVQYLLSFAILLPAAAQFASAQQGNPVDDPPGRVGRISVLSGSVSLQQGGDTAWSDATLNYALTTGDRLYTAEGSRAEIELGMAAVRLWRSTDLTITSLTDHLMQLGLAQGSIRVTLYRLDPNDSAEVDTPNGALTFTAAGSYRVDVAATGITTVSVDKGRIEVTGPGVVEIVSTGQAVLLTGADPITIESVRHPNPDAFDQWSDSRDNRVALSPCSRYMSSDIPGCADLGETGQWTNDATYGFVWFPPLVLPGWVPYQWGHWVWIEPWGWTWVEDEPWGYAPFHYGRWAHFDRGWGWIPGPIVPRPCYAPALVAFVGGSNFMIGFGVGVEAWFPLGPREPFFPWYHYSPRYLLVANQTNVRGISDFNAFIHPTDLSSIRYVNRLAATTVVPATTLSGGRSVVHDIIRATPAQVAPGQIAPHPSVAPTVGAIRGGKPAVRAPVGGRPPMVSGSGQRGGSPPPAVPRRGATPPAPPPRAGVPGRSGPGPIITRTPPPAGRPPFATRSQAMAQHPGRPLEPQQMRNLQAGRPAGPQHDVEFPPHPPVSAPRKPPTGG
ncbi:MAG TPA: DUF6600 domain-containing protein [Gemmatimonadaceae bacterium]|nr:DUF6600 domain-containing protein [Gemmatimonadaceae bacterium]